MQVGHGVQKRMQQVGRGVCLAETPARAFELLVQVPPRCILLHQVDVLAILKRAIQLDDVGVVELAVDANLTFNLGTSGVRD